MSKQFGVKNQLINVCLKSSVQRLKTTQKVRSSLVLYL